MNDFRWEANISDIFDDGHVELTVLLFTERWICQSLFNDAAKFERKQELMQLQFILFTICECFFVDAKFIQLACPQQQLNSY